MKASSAALLGLATVACSIALPSLFGRFGFVAFNVVFALELVFYLAAVRLVWRRPRWPSQLAVVLGAAVAFRLVLVLETPLLSDDVYRYVWDGRVQAAGINPYRFVPDAPELAQLRDADVFPHINRRSYAPTIYPPAAQIFFRVAHVFGGGVLGMKLILVLLDIGTIVMLARILENEGEDPARVIVYAWHPLACFEIAQSGHVDGLAITLVVGALAVMVRRPRPILAGALLGLATLVKGYPALAAPAFLRRGGARFCAGFIGAFLLYVPYAGAGARVLGFLPMYLQEEGVLSGDRFALLRVLRIVLPVPTAAFVFLIAVALLVASWRAIRAPEGGVRGIASHSIILGGIALILGTPHYAWYSVWILPFVTIARSPEGLWLGSSGALLYYAPHAASARMLFDVASDMPLIALLASRWRRAANARARLRTWLLGAS